MKIIELKLTDGLSGEGITAISFVKNPAIEHNWIAFSADGLEVKPSQQYAFKTVDEEQRIVAGPAMIPDKLILRQDADGEESFVFFKVDTIRELSERFLLQGRQNNMTLEHEATINDLSVVESWIVEDSEKDKSTIYGFNLPVGSWFVKVKVLNDDIWNLVKEKSVEGFSVEGVFTRELIKQSKEMKPKTKLDEYLEKIRGLVKHETPEEPEKFGTVDVADADGAVLTVSFPGEVLEVGAAITVTADGEELAVPVGEYLLSDGTILVVTEEGVVGELRTAEAEDETPEDELKEEGLKAEQMDKLIDGIAAIISTFQAEVKTDVAKAIEEMAAGLRVEFNKPAAEVEDETPEDENKKKIVKGLNRFVQEENKDK
jgi:hypothetical protein